MNWKVTFAVDYLLICDVFILGLERRLASHQLVEQNSEGPNIDPLVIVTPLNDFRRDIVHSTTESLSFAE
jgi:hypothetical protein